MLASLEVRNLLLIEDLVLDFAPGLNVLTGETGAGKSILLDALGFALGRAGARGGARELVGGGGDEAEVAAVFVPPSGHPVRALLEELGYPGGDELILRRLASRSCSTRGFINDRRAGAEALRRIGGALVEVHGQRDDRGLMDPRRHRALLDSFAGLEDRVAELRALWGAAREAEARRAEAEAALAQAAEDADWLRHALEELRRLAPELGEADRLDAERRLMKAAARIGEEVAKAAGALSPEGAEGLMSEALSRLTHVADRAEGLLDAPIEALDRALVELTEAQRGIEEAMERLAFDPGRLEAIEERLFAIRGLARKHRIEPDALPELAAEFERRLDDIDLGAERLVVLEAEARAARCRWREAAEALSAARREAAARLDKMVTRELAPLRMEKARFTTLIARAEEGPEGIDAVSFTAAINPGVAPGPIDRIASGGELSRFLLALKVCLAGADGGRVMIFDEIDRGIGGATADAVGRRLARLAEAGQVIVITHSPQVAARAAHHWRIVKRSGRGSTRTEVTRLDPASRIDELARMLAGARVTAEARAAAEALLSGVE